MGIICYKEEKPNQAEMFLRELLLYNKIFTYTFEEFSEKICQINENTLNIPTIKISMRDIKKTHLQKSDSVKTLNKIFRKSLFKKHHSEKHTQMVTFMRNNFILNEENYEDDDEDEENDNQIDLNKKISNKMKRSDERKQRQKSISSGYNSEENLKEIVKKDIESDSELYSSSSESKTEKKGKERIEIPIKDVKDNIGRLNQYESEMSLENLIRRVSSNKNLNRKVIQPNRKSISNKDVIKSYVFNRLNNNDIILIINKFLQENFIDKGEKNTEYQNIFLPINEKFTMENYKLLILSWSIGLINSKNISKTEKILNLYSLFKCLFLIYGPIINKMNLTEFIKLYIYYSTIWINQRASQFSYTNKNNYTNGYIVDLELQLNLEFLSEKIFNKEILSYISNKIVSLIHFKHETININQFINKDYYLLNVIKFPIHNKTEIFHINEKHFEAIEFEIIDIHELIHLLDIYYLRDFIINLYISKL